MVEDELLGYDDTASVAFIRNYIPHPAHPDHPPTTKNTAL